MRGIDYRSQILDLLDHNDEVMGSWDFVSQDEHPVLGGPCFFLHPCQTQSRLQILFEQEQCQTTTNPAIPFLSWLSMVLLVVHLPMPSATFQKILQVLREKQSL